ncbi:MAG: tetratricopeptide repeat protein, partial [Planctomycetota bacterium]
AVPVLSDAEIARQEKALAAAYDIFKAIRVKYAATPTAEQARAEIMIMIQHWRGIARWQRAANLGRQFLADNPTDPELPKLRLAVARDLLAWAAQPGKKGTSKQERLSQVADRFGQARAALGAIAKDFPREKAIVHEAQWELAGSFLTQARAVDAFSPTLARGQYVRAAGELQRVAATYYDHPNIAKIPEMLWSIASELAGRRYHDEAITVWNGFIIRHPTHSLAGQAAESIARTYRDGLRRPLLAAETYLEINFARGGADLGVQNQIYQIGAGLRNEKRWVEALHVLEVFVDSFPRHPSAGQALRMVGHIHQTNEAWTDAIAAYRRVINEFPTGTWGRDAKWSIAECTINLSQWRQATDAYRSYLTDYGKDPRAAEGKRRIGILKDLARYQALVDEAGQRKAFDAQYQIAEIVLGKLANPVKAIIEYRKVTVKWPKSHLADDALFKVGTTYLSMGETAKARKALLGVAEKYATSPLADDALYLVGKSYEDESLRLAGVTRERTILFAQKKAQREAYRQAQGRRGKFRASNEALIADLRKGGKDKAAEMQMARFAGREQQFQVANVAVAAQMAGQQTEALSAAQLAEREDKINAALRRAVESYLKASKVAAADKADEALLRMAGIYADKLKDADAAMKTYQEIVRQFSGTAVAEDASWRIAQYHERQGKHAEAIKAYEAFLRNYRRSPRAGPAQFAIAEGYEHLGEWIKAMDAYTNYINNFPGKPLVQKAKEQINWIKTYRL